MFVCVLLKLN